MQRNQVSTIQKGRLGCHYYPDQDHYTERDLAVWLPQLQKLGCTWLVLNTPTNRAIPEYFLTGLIKAGIQPVLHFAFGMNQPLPAGFQILCESYARWGVRYIILFDRPNRAEAWPAQAWMNGDLVERFLDKFVPMAETARQSKLTPLFPPLEPGGDYWDLAFLRQALTGIKRRSPLLLDGMGLTAIAAPGNHSLNWGAGGPERWPAARPYSTPNGSQDQRGFRIFDWYLATTRAILGRALPVILFGSASQDEKLGAQRTLVIAQLLNGNEVEEEGQPLEPIPSEVLCGCFWLLTTAPGNQRENSALFPPGVTPNGCVAALRTLAAVAPENETTANGQSKRLINHYLLLPAYDWGMDETSLLRLLPFIHKHRATVGFSLEEARHAIQVSVAGGLQAFPSEVISSLQESGCTVQRVLPDGTVLAI